MSGGLLTTANPRSRPSGGSVGLLPTILHTLYAQYHGGLKGDGVDLTDGTIVAGTNTLTSPSAHFVPSDTGKVIGVRGAGALGAWLIGTITYVNISTVTLSVTAANSVFAKEFFFGTDDTAALQALINRGFILHSCKFIFEYGLYILNGGLVTSVDGTNPNCQIYVPTVLANSSDYYDWARINGNLSRNVGMYVFEGELPRRRGLIGSASPTYPNQENNHFTGVRIRSTIQGSGTSPAIIGGIGGASNNLGFNPNNIQLKNLLLEVTAGKTAGGVDVVTMCAADMSNYKTCFMEFVDAAPHHFQFHASAQPTSDIFGFAYAGAGDDSISYINTCESAGFYDGHILGEHTHITNSASLFCLNAIKTINSKNYPMHVNHFLAQSCGFYLASHNGAADVVESMVDIQNAYMEASIGLTSFASGKWWANQGIVNDPNNNIAGDMCISHEDAHPAVAGTYMNGVNRIVGGKNLKVRLRANYILPSVTHTAAVTFAEMYELYHGRHDFTNATDIALTVPNSSDTRVNCSIGVVIKCVQRGAGYVIPTAAAGVTLLFPTSKTKSGGINTEFTLEKLDTNTWLVGGTLL